MSSVSRAVRLTLVKLQTAECLIAWSSSVQRHGRRGFDHRQGPSCQGGAPCSWCRQQLVSVMNLSHVFQVFLRQWGSTDWCTHWIPIGLLLHLLTDFRAVWTLKLLLLLSSLLSQVTSESFIDVGCFYKVMFDSIPLLFVVVPLVPFLSSDSRLWVWSRNSAICVA